MKKILLLLTLTLSFTLLSGCGLIATRETATLPAVEIPFPATPEIATATEMSLPTLSPPTPEPTIAPTPTEFIVAPIYASVVFDNYLLRSGPGRLFDKIAIYKEGTQVTVYGRAQGPDWVFVKTSDNMAGWMNSVGLEYLGEFSTLPIYHVPFALQLKGHVWLADKTPANLIGVALQPVNNTNPELMDNVMTGADGAWYVYLPLDSRGSWVIGPNSYGCPKDQPNGECPTPGQFPDAQVVTLPDAANVNIEFNLLP